MIFVFLLVDSASTLTCEPLDITFFDGVVAGEPGEGWPREIEVYLENDVVWLYSEEGSIRWWQ